MNQISLSDARQGLPRLIDDAQETPIVISRHGKPAAVVISPSLFEELIQAQEDLEDIVAFDAAVAEGGPRIPWEEIKKMLAIAHRREVYRR